MNHKLVESYIKDRLRKRYRGKHVYCEYGIAYVGSYAEIDFFDDYICLSGYKTLTMLNLDYPKKDDYMVNTLETIVSVIVAFANLEAVYDLYKEAI